MPLSPDSTATGSGDDVSGFAGAARRWNRKLHYYLGLYFLFFLWLFALTGLALNHPSWLPDYQKGRKVFNDERAIQLPLGNSALEDAQEIMQQLNIRGEIEWVATAMPAGRLNFRVNRPGENYDIKVDLNTRRATVQRATIDAWYTTQTLHSFTGVRAADSRNTRDWIVTSTWALAMDAIALGLIAMVATSLWLWWGLKEKRIAGAVTLFLGCAICGWFVFGLTWLAS